MSAQVAPERLAELLTTAPAMLVDESAARLIADALEIAERVDDLLRRARNHVSAAELYRQWAGCENDDEMAAVFEGLPVDVAWDMLAVVSGWICDFAGGLYSGPQRSLADVAEMSRRGRQ